MRIVKAGFLALFLATLAGPPASAAPDFPAFPNPDAGADPAVPAEKGGKGFPALAEGLGWQTNTAFPLIGDPSAKKGGELIRHVPDYPVNFRPEGPQANTNFNYLARDLMFDGLLFLHPNTLEWVPSLATHWKKEKSTVEGEGGRKTEIETFWFRIDPNARWADGSPVTSEDVIQSIKLRQDPTLGAPSTNETFNRFEVPVAESKYIVRVTCKEKNWRNFLYFAPAHVYPAKQLKPFEGKAEDWVKAFNTKHMMASGPYEMLEDDQKLGVKVTLRRRPGYWAKDYRKNVGLYNFDRISRLVITDQAIAFERLKKGDPGDINFLLSTTARRWVTEMRPDQIDAMKQGLIQKRKIYNEEPQGHYGLAMNMNRAPLDDVRVRQALTLLLPRQRLLKELMYRQYLPIRSYWPGTMYENKSNPKNDFDPREALRLLGEAGYKTRNNAGQLVNSKGEPLTLRLTYSTPGLEKHLTMYQESLQKAGVTLSLELTRGQQLWQQLMEKKYEMATIAWGALLFPNPESSFRSDYAKVLNNNNITGVADPEIDKLCDRYNELEIEQLDERVKIVQEIDGRLARLYPYVLFWYGPYQRFLYWNCFGYPESGLTRTGDDRDVELLWWWDAEKAKRVEQGKSDSSVTMPIGKIAVKYWREKDKGADSEDAGDE